MRQNTIHLFLFLLLLSGPLFGQQPGVIRLTNDKLHARVREWPYPAHGIAVPEAAPALMWPATNGHKVVFPMETGSDVPQDPNIGNVWYKVMLASDKSFTQNLIKSNTQSWAVYPVHSALAPGRWYWKYAYALKGSNHWTWSPVYDFVVGANASQLSVSPTAAEVLQRNQGLHPHLWNLHQAAESFYNNNLQNPQAIQFVAYAQRLLKAPLPEESPMRDIDTSGKSGKVLEGLMDRMYHGFGDKVANPVRDLCIAYYLTKDQRFIIDAKRRAINLLQMDPKKSWATRSDFNNGAILEALGWFYDMGYNFISSDEKKAFQKVMVERARVIYKQLPNRFELHVSDNHVWQITLRNLAIGTVALLGDVPEAKEWFSYMYEVWSARFPILGTTDGGWHEGNGYFLVNFQSIIYLSQLFSDFSGVDYFKLPWMLNLPYYLLYSFPPKGTSTAFGDQWENLRHGISKGYAYFAEALTYKINNTYLNWYVEEIRKNHAQFFNGTDDFLFFRLLNYKPGRQLKTASPTQLPKSKVFKDIGLAAMTENLTKADKNICSYLISSPFGSSGHAHAGQNAFTINYKGKTVLGASGYYSNFSDRHNLLDYRNTRAYCTILADSLSQKIGEEGYGWIARSMSGQDIQYALGDASNAYGPIESSFWLNRFKQDNMVADSANGFGDPGVTLYRRHMLQLKGGYIILYDELEAKKPIKWTTQFHAPYYTMVALPQNKGNRQSIEVKVDAAKLHIDVFASSPLKLKVHNRFAEPAINWMKLTDGKVLRQYTNQWHAGVTSQPAQKFRFLTIIRITEGQPEILKGGTISDGQLSVDAGPWHITAQLAGIKPAELQISNGSSVFDYGDATTVFSGKKYMHQKTGSSMLIERVNGNGKVNGKVNKQESIDVLPDVAKYDYK